MAQFHWSAFNMWIIWMILIFWVFFTPWNIPGNRRIQNSPLYILKKRYAPGEITKEQYLDQKKTLEQAVLKKFSI